jgi:hypothetical protein
MFVCNLEGVGHVDAPNDQHTLILADLPFDL